MNGQRNSVPAEDLPPLEGAFLLAQLGWHSAVRFGSRMESLGLTPPDAALLRAIAVEPGRTQQAVADQFQMSASRLVPLLDRLEGRGLVERRRDPADRRRNGVYLTPAGRALLRKIRDAAVAHHAEILNALDDDEKAVLVSLLNRLVEDQGLTRNVHPIFRNL